MSSKAGPLSSGGGRTSAGVDTDAEGATEDGAMDREQCPGPALGRGPPVSDSPEDVVSGREGKGGGASEAAPPGAGRGSRPPRHEVLLESWGCMRVCNTKRSLRIKSRGRGMSRLSSRIWGS